MTDSYNYGNINLGETAGLTRALISNAGAALGSTLANFINFTGAASVFGDITLIQSITDGTLIRINQPGTYFISATVQQVAGGADEMVISAGQLPDPLFLSGTTIDDGLVSNVSGMITITPADINDLPTSFRNIRFVVNNSPKLFFTSGNFISITKV